MTLVLNAHNRHIMCAHRHARGLLTDDDITIFIIIKQTTVQFQRALHFVVITAG